TPSPRRRRSPVGCLAGGSGGWLLFRVWIMVLTSAARTLLMTYFSLSLANAFAKVDVVALAERRALTINWAAAGVVLMGVVAQLFLDRRRLRQRSSSPSERPAAPAAPLPWLRWAERTYRRAGY